MVDWEWTVTLFLRCYLLILVRYKKPQKMAPGLNSAGQEVWKLFTLAM